MSALTGSASFVEDAEEDTTGEQTARPAPPSGAVEATVESLQQAIDDVRRNLAELEESIDRLTESLSNQ